MKIRSGTSGYSYKEWKGEFYPEKCADLLEAYAQRLPTVEINSTFYRIPRKEVVQGWAKKTPESFCFSVKISQRVTHMARLKSVGEPLGYFLDSVRELGPRLGPLLAQLHPQFKKDTGRLRDFLELLPDGARAALEFRHESWLCDETYTLLADKGAALVSSDEVPELERGVNTADFVYARMRREGYEEAELRALSDRLKASGCTEAFVYFKHETLGPFLAKRFLEMAD